MAELGSWYPETLDDPQSLNKLFTIQHLKGKVCETLGLKEGTVILNKEVMLEWLLGVRTRRKGIPGPDNSLGKGTVA